jgi:hypothetical protein
VHISMSIYEDTDLTKIFIVFQERFYLVGETPLFSSLASPNSAVFCLGA